MPTEKILQRFTNALDTKREQYLAAKAKGIVSDQDCYVLAVNSRGIPHAPHAPTVPFLFQALLPIGNLTLMIDRATGQATGSCYALRETITNAAGSAVSTTHFLDPQFEFVSAVIHSSVDCGNRPAELGGASRFSTTPRRVRWSHRSSSGANSTCTTTAS